MNVAAICPSLETKDLFTESFLWGYRNLSSEDLALSKYHGDTDKEKKTSFLESTYDKEVELYESTNDVHWIAVVNDSNEPICVMIVETMKDGSTYLRQLFAKRGQFFKHRLLFRQYLLTELHAKKVWFVTRRNRFGKKCDKLLKRLDAQQDENITHPDYSKAQYGAIVLNLRYTD